MASPGDRFEGMVTNLLRRHAGHASDADTAYLETLGRLLVRHARPECGEARGQIVAEGAPETVAAGRASITGQMLNKLLQPGN